MKKAKAPKTIEEIEAAIWEKAIKAIVPEKQKMIKVTC